MKLMHPPLTLAVLAAFTATAARAEVAVDVIGGSEISLEGLLQADGNWFNNDLADLNGISNNGKDSEFELRRAEIVLKGKGPGNFEWVMGYDAKADKFLDTNFKYKLGGNSNHYLQVGQYKQPNSLEELSSTKNNDFISKAAVTNAYAVARRLGAAYSYGTTDWGFTASLFGRELTRNLAHGSGYGLRGTWAPINQKENVLHLGVAYANYDTDADTFRLRVRPQADLATVRLVDAGNMTDTDRIATASVEAAWVNGPLKLQGEYYRSRISRYNNVDYTSSGGYVSALWNLTGESWGYRNGVLTTPGPDEPASGMWQVGLRYDAIDLNDGNVAGGKMGAWTIGANWYWRSNFKFMLNYAKVSSERRGVNDDPSILEARAQFFW